MVQKIKRRGGRDPNPNYKRDGSNGPRMLPRKGKGRIVPATIGGANDITYAESRELGRLNEARRKFLREHTPDVTVKKLRELAQVACISGRSKMGREALINALSAVSE